MPNATTNSKQFREFIQSNTQFYLKNSLETVPSFNTKYWILSENSIFMVHNAFRQELKKSLKLTFWQLLRLENQTIQIALPLIFPVTFFLSWMKKETLISLKIIHFHAFPCTYCGLFSARISINVTIQF